MQNGSRRKSGVCCGKPDPGSRMKSPGTENHLIERTKRRRSDSRNRCTAPTYRSRRRGCGVVAWDSNTSSMHLKTGRASGRRIRSPYATPRRARFPWKATKPRKRNVFVGAGYNPLCDPPCLLPVLLPCRVLTTFFAGEPFSTGPARRTLSFVAPGHAPVRCWHGLHGGVFPGIGSPFDRRVCARVVERGRKDDREGVTRSTFLTRLPCEHRNDIHRI